MLRDTLPYFAPPNPSTYADLRYRSHIDGLRAIAILSVVFFHVGFRPLRGGYAGVDIFFVISGFLISRIVYNAAESRAFSFADFYSKRAIRILPALFIVIAASGLASFFVQLPPEFLSFSRSALAAVVFGANIWFWETTNYFGAAADQTPLLHLWSLGVEEQFYIAFPIIALAAYRIGWQGFSQVLAILFALSLATCCYYLTVAPEAAFYLTPLRAYELLIGCLLSLRSVPVPSNVEVACSASLVGLSVILLSVVFLDPSVAFPGLAALVPCFGTAVFIWSGEGPRSWPVAIIGSLPIRFVGKISYSMYLVHWPIIVFAHRLFPYAGRVAQAWAIVGLSAGCAVLLFLCVETPARRLRHVSKPLILSGSAAFITAVSGAAVYCIIMNGFPSRISARINDVLAYLHYDGSASFRSGTCFISDASPFSSLKLDECEPQYDGKRAVIWGDSGMAMYASAMQASLKVRGYSMGQFTASSCPPTLGVMVATRPNCKDFNDRVINEIRKLKPDLVILGGVWLPGDGTIALLDQTIQQIRDTGAHTVVLGYGPSYRSPLPTILANKLSEGDPDTFMPSKFLWDDVLVTDRAMQQHWNGRSDVTYISIMSSVCRDGRCPLQINGVPVQFDAFHLTLEGAKLFLNRIMDQIVPAA